MATLYEELQESTDQQRRDTAALLIAGMRLGATPEANNAYAGLCEELIGELGIQGASEQTLRDFSAQRSAHLVREIPRTQGFLNAIARVPRFESAIDAGCGSSAILSVAAALSYPGVHVWAYDVDPGAVLCAHELVSLLGLKRQIDVEERDVLARPLPDRRVELGLTETFTYGLLVEPGADIAKVLAGRAEELLPAGAVVFARTGDAAWQYAGYVNFRSHDGFVYGGLLSVGSGEQLLSVRTGLVDQRRESILTEFGSSTITGSVPLGRMMSPPAGTQIRFMYEMGVSEAEFRPRVWTEE